MRPHWYLMFGISLLLHLAVFWPEPAAIVRGERRGPLFVDFIAGRAAGVAPFASDEVLQDVLAQREGQVPAVGAHRAPAAAPAGIKPGLARMREWKVRSTARAEDSALGMLSSDSLPSPAVFDDSDEVAQMSRYRLALAAAAVRLQGVAGLSSPAGLHGRSVVVVRVRPGAVLPDVDLAESSGQPALDDSALELVRRAAASLQLPVRRQEFTLALPVLFEAM